MPDLRCLTYLSPGLPYGLFQDVVDYLADTLSIPTSLHAEESVSGPAPDRNPLVSGEADLAWMCTPSYLWSRARTPGAVALVPAAIVFDDARNDGLPYYYSDVVVHRDSDASTFRDLRGQRWTYNDTSSQSGYFNLLQALARRGETLSYFSSVSASGSHRASLRRVVRGDADAAAIDSNVLGHVLRSDPTLRHAIRVLTSWGPHAMQPFVASTAVGVERVDAIARALLDMHRSPSGEARLRAHGVRRFAPIQPSFYADERRALAAGEGALTPCAR